MEQNRESYKRHMGVLKKNYEHNPNDEKMVFDYAEILFQLGNFSQSQKILKSLFYNANPSPQVIYLSSQIEYLMGNYIQAEKLFNMLTGRYSDEYKLQAEAGLLMVYYQTNQYHKVNQIFIGQDHIDPLAGMGLSKRLLKSFGDNQPYQIDWNGKDESVIPFVVTDPLPIVSVELNGKRLNAIIDTGGNMFVVDKVFATKFDIKPASNMEGLFAGGNTAEISFGRTDLLSIGDINIHNIPVMVGTFEGFADTFKDYVSDVHGVIGTNVLRNFLTTIDYSNGQLILRSKNEAGKNNLKKMLAGDEIIEEIPFTLALSHFIIGKGSINQKDGLNFFVDSGYPEKGYEKGKYQSGIILAQKTMDSLGIPIPELMAAVKGQGGMGGSDYKYGHFSLSTYGLGNMQLKNGFGSYQTGLFEQIYFSFGFFIDALISHNYLKNYKWTIDFDSMMMKFTNQIKP